MTTGPLEKDIEKLFSILPHLCEPETIGNAFQHDPDVVTNAIKAIELALAEGVPVTRTEFSGSTVPLRLVRSRIQILKPRFVQPAFWIKTGLSREELRALANSFRKAEQDIESRTEEQANRDHEANRKQSLERQATIHKKLKLAGIKP